MRISITLSANAGIAIDFGGRRIWVDALHEGKQHGFSTVSTGLQGRMLASEAFKQPEYICYTHCHGDHYSENLTDAAVHLWPRAKVLAPEGKYQAFCDDAFLWEDNGLQIRFVKLPHEGEQYKDVRHYGLLISYQGATILIPGDCATGSEALAQAIGGIHVDLALLDFPWLTLRKGKEFVLRHFGGSRVLLYHLPFEEDDVCGYRDAAVRAVAATPQLQDLRLLMQPLQQECYEIG